MEYDVEITETLQRVVKAEADSADGAVNKVKALYRDEEIVLDSADYVNTEYSLAQKL